MSDQENATPDQNIEQQLKTILFDSNHDQPLFPENDDLPEIVAAILALFGHPAPPTAQARGQAMKNKSDVTKPLTVVPSKRGYFGVGVYHPKTQENIGTLWRHARLYGADFIFTIGRRYKKQASDTSNTSLHIPLYNYTDYQDFIDHQPYNCPVVCVELAEGAQSLPSANHPERAVYLLGAEDKGIPKEVLRGKQVIQIPAAEPQSMNVAVSGTVVMYDRYVKQLQRQEAVNDLVAMSLAPTRTHTKSAQSVDRSEDKA